MPHDRNGAALAIGDRVRIPVHRLTNVQVVPNPDFPNEYPATFTLLEDAGVLYGTVEETYPREDACNALFRVSGAVGPSTFNTRLVERIEEVNPDESHVDEAEPQPTEA